MNQARSRAIDRLRYERRKKRVNPHADDPPAIAAPQSDEDDIDLKERGRRLRDALKALTPDEREAIESTYFCELSYAEAAARLNQPLGTVKTRIRSALGKLRQVLNEKAERS
jgi:RNA polymerase sigma-70 factor (ECF subfamily)